MNREETVNEMVKTLYSAICLHGLRETLAAVFGSNVKITIPQTAESRVVPVSNMKLSTRPQNALRRAGIENAGQIMEVVSNGSINSIKNLGVNSIREIKEELLKTCFYSLDDEGKICFCRNLLEDNGLI